MKKYNYSIALLVLWFAAMPSMALIVDIPTLGSDLLVGTSTTGGVNWTVNSGGKSQ